MEAAGVGLAVAGAAELCLKYVEHVAVHEQL